MTKNETIENMKNPDFFQNWLSEMMPKALSFALQVIIAMVVYAIGTRVIRFLLNMTDKSLERRGVDDGVRSFMRSVLRVVFYAILIVIILGCFGVTTASVVAILGSAGLTLGLALQGALSNFAGGVLILLNKPFVVGDYIKFMEGREGFVTEITIIYTTLKDRNGVVYVIPNGKLSNDSIVNYTVNGRRRIYEPIVIPYEADIEKARRVLLTVLSESEGRLEDENYFVDLSELKDSGVELSIAMWVDATDYWSILPKLRERCKKALEKEKIYIPYNKLDVNIIGGGECEKS